MHPLCTLSVEEENKLNKQIMSSHVELEIQKKIVRTKNYEIQDLKNELVDKCLHARHLEKELAYTNKLFYIMSAACMASLIALSVQVFIF